MSKSSMSIATFLKVAAALPQNISILIRGKHGIGKSQLVARLAREFKLPLIDRRLAQLSEGDVIGLPKLTDDITRFCPPDWYLKACQEPVVLFLDELNRALPEVMQAAFQIVLDRELNGHKLHPGTRVFAAVNMGAEYSVNEMDPALLRRFWTVDLEPTVEEWIDGFARGYLAEELVDFIQANKGMLDPPAKADLNDVHTTRHSWERLDQSMKFMNNSKTEILPIEDPLFYPTAVGFLGVEAAISFRDFVKNRDRQISGEDILNGYKTKKIRDKVKSLGQEKWNVCIDKLQEEINKATSLSAKQEDNISLFMGDLPGELRIAMWTKMTAKGTDRLEIVKGTWKKCTVHLLDVFGIKKDGDGNQTPVIPEFLKNLADKK